jgi:hypothetical protein
MRFAHYLPASHADSTRKLEYRLQVTEERYNLPTAPAAQKRSLLDQLEELKQEITRQNDDVADISRRMSKRGREAETISQSQTLVDHQLPTESTREFLIREHRNPSFQATLLTSFRNWQNHAV